MEQYQINPLLSHTANLLLSKMIFPTTEYQKNQLTQNSYVFAPNHTNNLDGYLIWSLLAKDYDIDTFMYKEFWDNFPRLASFLPHFHVYPITRDKVKINEIRNELKKLQDPNHSLVIFPQGRHVDPEVMLHLFDYHLKTIPLGAFYLSALSSKPLVPIYMEPEQAFHSNTVIYGTPLNPNDFEVISPNGRIKKKKLLEMAKAWLIEINKAYQIAPELAGRKMRPYPIHKSYFDASGLHHNTLQDPNVIANYLEEIQAIGDLNLQTRTNDLDELGKTLGISIADMEQIKQVKETYEKCLVRRK